MGSAMAFTKSVKPPGVLSNFEQLLIKLFVRDYILLTSKNISRYETR